MPTKLQTGFTLVELIIVVAIISILASTAIPAYNGYVETSKRSDGQASLIALAIAQEKFRATCSSYATEILDDDNDGVNDSVCDTSTPSFKVEFDTTSDGGYYTLVITSASGSGFTAQADPTFAQTSCDTADFQITEDGPDLGSDAKKACWGR